MSPPREMPSLLEWQREFQCALLDAARPLPERLQLRGADRDRFAIYRSNGRIKLCSALRLVYPVVEKLVGAEFFDYAARCFIERQPSRTFNLDEYGGEFPDFLRSFAAAAALPYLADVAALEAAIDALARAADGAVLHLASPFPILRIWCGNQAGFAGDDRISLDEGGDRLRVYRERGEVLIEKLSR